MASSPCADRRAAARSAALAAALAAAPETPARRRPQMSGSHEAPMAALKLLFVCCSPPPPERAPLPVRFTVGNREARCSRTSARACSYEAMAAATFWFDMSMLSAS